MYYLGMCLFEKHNLMVILQLDTAKVMRFLGWLLSPHVRVCMCVCLPQHWQSNGIGEATPTIMGYTPVM